MKKILIKVIVNDQSKSHHLLRKCITWGLSNGAPGLSTYRNSQNQLKGIPLKSISEKSSVMTKRSSVGMGFVVGRGSFYYCSGTICRHKIRRKKIISKIAYEGLKTCINEWRKLYVVTTILPSVVVSLPRDF